MKLGILERFFVHFSWFLDVSLFAPGLLSAGHKNWLLKLDVPLLRFLFRDHVISKVAVDL